MTYLQTSERRLLVDSVQTGGTDTVPALRVRGVGRVGKKRKGQMMLHGQSERHTPAKQMQLLKLLEIGMTVWKKDNPWAHPTRWFIDCMAGSGHSKKGHPGSPIILQDCADHLDDAVCVWCDKASKHTKELQLYQHDRTQILCGRYQELVMEWLQHHKTLKPVLGVVYLDDNGCKEIWQNDGFLSYLFTTFSTLDVALHFSETAWKRNSTLDWAVQTSVVAMLEKVLIYKPSSVVWIDPMDSGQHWRLVYGVRSLKMKMTGPNCIKLRDYVESIKIDQTDFFGQLDPMTRPITIIENI